MRAPSPPSDVAHTASGDVGPLARHAPLDAAAIERGLSGALDGGPAWRVRVVGSTGSTNSDLLAEVRLQRTFDGPALLAAEIQHAGRGRHGRRWVSAPGASLTLSLAVQVGRRLSALDGVTLVCGLAVHDALAAAGVATSLKWPNDILRGDRKLGGILVEAHALERTTVLVVGIGLNVASPGTPEKGDGALAPADLVGAGLASPDRNALAVALATALETQLAAFANGGFTAFAARWNALDAWRDRRVAITGGLTAPIVGIARGVDDTGALLIDVDGEARRRRVIVGDVSLRPVLEAAA